MKTARRHGDRRDGKLLRDLDPMHFIMPIIYPNRCDNEAFISEKIDLTEVDAYLEKKNAGDPDYRFTLFQLITVAMLRVCYLRPRLNRFIVNGDTFQRNYVSASFVVKKRFADSGEEGLAFVKAQPGDSLDSIHDAIYSQINLARSDTEQDSTSDAMDMLNRLPRFIGKAAVRFIAFLDRHGWVPASMTANDPYYSTVVLTNLGSIKLHSGYHHLTNWGTNSLFVIVGERKPRPFTAPDGTVTMKDSIDLGLTVDERIGDGYYFSRSVALLRKLLEHPELLEQEMQQEVDY